jgi:hypothetical protein
MKYNACPNNFFSQSYVNIEWAMEYSPLIRYDTKSALDAPPCSSQPVIEHPLLD